MSTAGLFDLAFYLAAPFWALMILAPGWSWTRRIIASPLIVLPTLAVYLVLTVPVFGELWGLVTRPSLAAFTGYLADPRAAASTWAQIIAWDLLVGRWLYRRMRAERWPAWASSPLLVLTVLVSPFALLLFFALRRVVPVTFGGRRPGGSLGAERGARAEAVGPPPEGGV